MRLLWLNLATDLDDPVLGFTPSWIREIAKLVESIQVITMRQGRVNLPKKVSVSSVGKERGFTEPKRVFEFYRHLLRILHQEHIDLCFSHMIPIFSVLSFLPLKASGIPMISWYAHGRGSAILRLAHHLSDGMVSINTNSYPYRVSKLTTLGHGIDTELFKPNLSTSLSDPPLILFVGRLSPIKDPLTFVRAARLLRNKHRFQVALIGPILERDRAYSRMVVEEIGQLRETVPTEFISGIPQDQLANWYQRCFALVHCSPSSHSLDKTVLEALACGKLALTSSLGFEETMGQEASRLLFQAGCPHDLSTKLDSLLTLPREDLYERGNYLRKRTIQMHSLTRLAQQLTQLFDRSIHPGAHRNPTDSF